MSIRLGPISHCTFRNPERPVQPVNWAFGISEGNSSDFFHLSVFSFSAAFCKYDAYGRKPFERQQENQPLSFQK